MVKVFKEVKFYVPSGFTPNQDGLNDYLKPLAVGIREVKFFRVYNRWGQLVFDLKDDPRGWDGMIDGKLQATQAVVWVAEGLGINNQMYRQKGTCVLIR
jgi:gliding motility-associated-like protein